MLKPLTLAATAACSLALSFVSATGTHSMPAPATTADPAADSAAGPKPEMWQETPEEDRAWPEANPDDVESIDAIVASLYDVISGAKGEERDWDRFRSLFHPELGILIPLRPGTDPAQPTWSARGLKPDDYVASAKKWSQRTGFFEREISRREDVYGGIAHVWSTYAGFNAVDAPDPFVRGINTIQLMQDGERWWVVSIAWDAESASQPLPEKYLPVSKGSK